MRIELATLLDVPELLELQRKAFGRLRLDYETVGANGSMLMVTTTGTAVVI
jgi:uncharacterized protein YbjQ (UPF0145 family)